MGPGHGCHVVGELRFGVETTSMRGVHTTFPKRGERALSAPIARSGWPAGHEAQSISAFLLRATALCSSARPDGSCDNTLRSRIARPGSSSPAHNGHDSGWTRNVSQQGRICGRRRGNFSIGLPTSGAATMPPLATIARAQREMTL